MDLYYYIFAVLGFLAVILLIEGLYLAWNAWRGPQARQIAQRLRAMSAGGHAEQTQVSLVKRRLLSTVPLVDRVLLELPRIHSLDRFLEQSGSNLSVAQMLLVIGTSAGAAAFFSLLLNLPMPLVVVLALLAAVVPLLLISNERENRIHHIEEQLPDALDLMARALRAGHAFLGALQMVADEAQEPVAGEFRITFDEINFGVSTQDALMNLASRVPSTDLRYFVIAVLIQRDTGGNLAELLDNISRIMRERMRFAGTIRVLSAEGKMSAWILGVLPFALAGVINYMNPKFMAVLWTDPMGQKMVAGALLMMAFGIFWLWRITKIRA